MKSTLVLALPLALFACTSTTKGEGPAGGSSSSSSGSSSGSNSGSSSGSSSGGTTSSGGGTSSSGGISNSQCQSICIGKVYECNPDAVDAPGLCRELCGGVAYTSEQLDCFQSASCFELQNASEQTLSELCPP